MVDCETHRQTFRCKKSHECPLYSLLVFDSYLVATGDEDGTLKLWDYRQQKCVMTLSECEDFISDITTNSDAKVAVLTSGEGTLSAVDIRAKKLLLQSELFDSELLSAGVIKNDQKVVCGCSEGVLHIFNWGEWGNMSDRFPVSGATSIDCLVRVTDDIICTGSMDGNVRLVQIHPNRVVSCVGEHDDEMPIEDVAISHDGTIICSCSDDQVIRFWNISDIVDGQEQQDDSPPPRKKRTKKSGGTARQRRGGTDFFAQMD